MLNLFWDLKKLSEKHEVIIKFKQKSLSFLLDPKDL